MFAVLSTGFGGRKSCGRTVIAAGMQGRPYAINLDLGLQIVVIAGGVFHWSIAVVGVVFGSVWLYIRYIKGDVEKRVERGMLPGQEPID